LDSQIKILPIFFLGLRNQKKSHPPKLVWTFGRAHAKQKRILSSWILLLLLLLLGDVLMEWDLNSTLTMLKPTYIIIT
jgi:hypothetical protein